MARGNQRDKAREKNLKDQAGKKPKNEQSGTQYARTKEQQAAIMRQKQDEGMTAEYWLSLEGISNAKKAAESSGTKK
ncbi:MAG: hypothetical protein M1827_002890 [Pycnora praestabilis]|nr:MAG: hypothetical protein M1827_002890 [Pycnora praestabilis]